MRNTIRCLAPGFYEAQGLVAKNGIEQGHPDIVQTVTVERQADGSTDHLTFMPTRAFFIRRLRKLPRPPSNRDIVWPKASRGV